MKRNELGKIIGIDLRCLPMDGSAGAGVAHATRFLVEALIRLEVPWTWRLYLPAGAEISLPKNHIASVETVILKSARGSALRTNLKQFPCDVLFVPSGSVAPGISTPQIPWVHDVAIFSHPEWFPQSWFKRLLTTTLFQRGLRKASFILSVSEDTKSELVNRFKLDPAKIFVTHEGGDPILAELKGEKLEQAKAEARARGVIKKPFMLVLGTVEPRKNILMLIKAWRASESRTQHDLVIAGRNGWNMEKIQIEDGLIRLEDVNDEVRRDLLLSADLVAVPSLYEGFGLVALEAMQAGTALISSNMGALSEVVKSGFLIDPNSQIEWTEIMNKILANSEACKQMGQMGKRQSERFSWENSAKTVTQAIAKLISI